MSPYLRYRTSDAQIRNFGLDDMCIDYRCFQVFPVPSHVIESVFFPYATFIGETVVQILLYIQPGKDTLHIYTQTVIGTHPEICPYTDVIIEGISLGIHFLGHFITRRLDGTGKRRIDHIVLISDIIIKPPRSVGLVERKRRIPGNKVMEAIIGRDHTTHPLRFRLLGNNVNDTSRTSGIVRSIRMGNHLYILDSGSRNR